MDVLLLVLIPVVVIYIVICAVFFGRTKAKHYDPWKSSRPKRRDRR